MLTPPDQTLREASDVPLDLLMLDFSMTALNQDFDRGAREPSVSKLAFLNDDNLDSFLNLDIDLDLGGELGLEAGAASPGVCRGVLSCQTTSSQPSISILPLPNDNELATEDHLLPLLIYPGLAMNSSTVWEWPAACRANSTYEHQYQYQHHPYATATRTATCSHTVSRTLALEIVDLPSPLHHQPGSAIAEFGRATSGASLSGLFGAQSGFDAMLLDAGAATAPSAAPPNPASGEDADVVTYLASPVSSPVAPPSAMNIPQRRGPVSSALKDNGRHPSPPPSPGPASVYNEQSSDGDEELPAEVRKPAADSATNADEDLLPFECPFEGCNRRFATKDKVKNHRSVLYRTQDLNRHLSTHQSVKQHRCQACGKRFTRKDGLAGHVSKGRCKRGGVIPVPGNEDDGDQALDLKDHDTFNMGFGDGLNLF
ncbi:hypothetical protein HK101_008330 [Irineochytrium annulatum]|nr:hypothetical protein HK101_008330 [Irineochytrium annulatum]